MSFKRKTQVEFGSSIPCRVLAPQRYSPKVIRVPEGTVGRALDDTDHETLPGDVPVLIELDVPGDGPQNLVVAAREGCLAAVDFELDPETDRPAFKHYRNLKVRV